MDLQNIKSDHFKDRIQIVIFEESGRIKESCNTLFSLNASNENLFTKDVFFESIVDTVQSIKRGDILDYPCIGPNLMGRDGYYDLSFKKHDSYFELAITDLTRYYNFIVPIQQERNDLDIQKEYLHIRQKALHLEKKLLELQNSEQKRLQEIKESFFAQVNHEMRTPLTSMTGIIELLINNNQDESVQNNYFRNLEKVVTHLSSIVDDILDLSKIEAKKMELNQKKFNLHKLIDDVVDSFSYTPKQKDIKVTYDIDNAVPKYVYGDPKKLSQVLYNVIGNAVKYTFYGTIELIVSSSSTESHKCNLQFKVEDTGIGMNEDELKNFFQPFVRAKSISDKEYQGTGLGMSIVKEMITLMKGEISVKSRKGLGTIVSFNIPFQIQTETEKSPKNLDQELQKFRFIDKVIILEDDEMAALVLTDLLKNLDIKSSSVSNKQEFLEILDEEWFDLLILDKQLDDEDGLELFEELRNRNISLNDLPVLLVTGENVEDIPKFIDGVVKKPYTLKKLRSKLGSLDEWLCESKLVNERYLKEISHGDEKMRLDLIEVFINEMSRTIKEIRDFITYRKFTEIEKNLHKAIPNATYSGITGLADLIILLEGDLKKSTNIDLVGRINEIDELLRRGIKKLEIVARSIRENLQEHTQE